MEYLVSKSKYLVSILWKWQFLNVMFEPKIYIFHCWYDLVICTSVCSHIPSILYLYTCLSTRLSVYLLIPWGISTLGKGLGMQIYTITVMNIADSCWKRYLEGLDTGEIEVRGQKYKLTYDAILLKVKGDRLPGDCVNVRCQPRALLIMTVRYISSWSESVTFGISGIPAHGVMWYTFNRI